MKPRFIALFRYLIAISLMLGLILPQQGSVSAAAILKIEPITWNIVGLDSNNVTVGPNHFPVGARVCNKGDTAATNISSTFVWDSADSFVNLRSGTLSNFTGTNAVSSLAPDTCTDFYYEIQVERDPNAYNPNSHTRRYHITATADGLGTVSTPMPRELYVEHLISQNRNTVSDVRLDGVSIPAGGTMNLMVGQTYKIKLFGSTATQGYEQLESFINFPNTIFQVSSVKTTYTAESSLTLNPPYDKLYGDACSWENDLNSPNYRACNDMGKAGGNITVEYTVKIISAGSGGAKTLSTLIYDFSGSSFHYNSDYSTSARYAVITDPSDTQISKTFLPDTITPGGTSTLVFTITNPTTTQISGVKFTDTFPNLMEVANPPNATATGCGISPTFSLQPLQAQFHFLMES